MDLASPKSAFDPKRPSFMRNNRTGLFLAPTYNWFTEGFDAPDMIIVMSSSSWKIIARNPK